jgi:hypothetical protein
MADTMTTATHDILDRLLDPVGRILTQDVAERLVRLKVDAKTQKMLDRLARRCNEGKLTDAERHDYEVLVYALDFIAILQAKARGSLKRAAASP